MVSQRTDKQISGDFAEKRVSDQLEKTGYSILERNFYCHWGELDIVAKKDSIFYFIEVRYREDSPFVDVAKILNKKKLTALKRSVMFYVKKNKLSGGYFRFVLYLVLKKGSELQIQDYDISYLFGGEY